MKIDLHVHTTFSPDSLLSPEDLIRLAERNRLGCVAVTDHNTIAGALEVVSRKPAFKVIIGAEISTREGEIIGLFLQKEIPANLGIMETIALIKEQRGIVVLPHPSDRLRHHALNPAYRERVLPEVDLVEGYNGRTVFIQDDRDAASLAAAYGKPVSAGSDSHTKWELGRCGMEVPEFETREQFLNAVKNGHFFGHRAPPWIHVITKTVKLANQTGLRKYERM